MNIRRALPLRSLVVFNRSVLTSSLSSMRPSTKAFLRAPHWDDVLSESPQRGDASLFGGTHGGEHAQVQI